MDWFDGTILDGIQTAKRNCSLFVVFVHGKEKRQYFKNKCQLSISAKMTKKNDQKSRKMSEMMNKNPKWTDRV